MNRCGSVVTTLVAGLGVVGCSVSSPLEYAARVEPELGAQATVYEARIFTQLKCEDIELAPGRLDLALTATATFRFTASDPAGFAPVDLSSYGGELALDLRARAADGTLVGRRCTPVVSSTEVVVVNLARFAPADAQVELFDGAALVAGEAQRPARIRVVDATQKGVERVFASLGVDRPLLASDALGFIDIESSTTTVDAGTTRTLTVLGVPGVRVPITAEALTPAACPDSAWSREIVPGLAGAQIAIAAADAGPRTLIALLRPTAAAAATNTIEILAADEGATSLRSLATATTAAAGHVAIAADRTTGAATIAVIRDGTIELRSFDGASNMLGPARVHALGLVPGGRIDGLRGAFLGAAGDRFVAFGDVPMGVVTVTRTGTVAPLLSDGDRRVVDLLIDADGVALTTADGFERFAWVGGQLQANGTTAAVRGQLARVGGGQARVMALDGMILSTVGDDALLDAYDVGAAALAVAAGDANGDGVDDLLTLVPSGVRLVLSSPAGRVLHATSCAMSGEPRAVVALPLDRGGRTRWAAVLDETGRLALWVQP